jgi:hypothetical protein
MKIQKLTINIMSIILFIIGWSMALWGAFEMAYRSGEHPVWSGTFGYPVPHHYIIGFIICLLVYLWTLQKWDFNQKI